MNVPLLLLFPLVNFFEVDNNPFTSKRRSTRLYFFLYLERFPAILFGRYFAVFCVDKSTQCNNTNVSQQLELDNNTLDGIFVAINTLIVLTLNTFSPKIDVFIYIRHTSNMLLVNNPIRMSVSWRIWINKVCFYPKIEAAFIGHLSHECCGLTYDFMCYVKWFLVFSFSFYRPLGSLHIFPLYLIVIIYFHCSFSFS